MVNSKTNKKNPIIMKDENQVCAKNEEKHKK
jgi:hypothetical protein